METMKTSEGGNESFVKVNQLSKTIKPVNNEDSFVNIQHIQQFRETMAMNKGNTFGNQSNVDETRASSNKMDILLSLKQSID